jgi:hypothetical protein
VAGIKLIRLVLFPIPSPSDGSGGATASFARLPYHQGAALTVAAFNHILTIKSLMFCVALCHLVSFGVALSHADISC